MPANWQLFETSIKNYFVAKQANDFRESSTRIANAYHSAVMSGASTAIGNLCFGGNVSSLRFALEKAFWMNYHMPPNAGERERDAPLLVIAGGLIAYWYGARFNPFPPHPPCVAPSYGIQVLYAGNPFAIAPMLKAALSTGTEETSVKLLIATFRVHMMQISGLYIGVMPSPLGPVPAPPIPWFGVF